MKAMGRVMGALQPQIKGRADGGAVAAAVRAQLGCRFLSPLRPLPGPSGQRRHGEGGLSPD